MTTQTQRTQWWKGRLLLGPKGADHAMEVLHHAAMGHLGVKKLIPKCREWYMVFKDRKLTEDTVRN